MEDLNRQVEDWLNTTANARTHATTGEVPAVRLEVEKGHLMALPQSSYVPMITLGRRVSRDGYVAYNGNDYSVPEGLTQPEVTIAATLEEVRFYQHSQLVAVHPILEVKGQRRLDPSHQRRARKESPDRWRFEAGSPQLIEGQRRPLEVYEEVLR
jgi:hypothetical protein